MKPERLIMTALAGLAAGCATPPSTTPRSADLEGELTAFMESYNAAIAERDPEKVRSFYATGDRFVWIEEGAVRYRAPEDILAALAAVPEGTVIRTKLSDIGVAAVGSSAAHAWAAFHTTIGDASDGFSFSGTVSMVLEHDGDAWRIVGGHSSGPGTR
jgi:ketosteroid isomerase-like protein